MAGIYIHIPFCKQACTYCDFHFSSTFESYRQKMIDVMCQEIKERKSFFSKGDVITTIYFGGGTPSVLSENELTQIMNSLYNDFNLSQLDEVTLEANPDDINEEKLAIWKKNGVNRLSIGIQSFRQEDLDWMNRAHTVEEAINCIKMAQKSGFTNLTVDLIYGLPNLSVEAWKSHILKLLALEVPHVSAYCLTVEPKTILNTLVKTKKIYLPNNESQAEHFDCLVDTLNENGFEQYEVSNFSLPNFNSKHNSNYWKNEKYLGIGPSAHSFNQENRSWNIANNNLYIKNIENNSSYFEEEVLTPANRFNEFIMTGLRTKWGVDLKKLATLHEIEPAFWLEVDKFKVTSEMIQKDNTLYLSKKGLLRADFIASVLFV